MVDLYAPKSFFIDDVKMVTDLLNDNWDSEIEDKPLITYDKEGVLADSRYGKGYIFVYQVSRYNSVGSVDSVCKSIKIHFFSRRIFRRRIV